MAEIITEGRSPMCSGCGEEFYYIPGMLDSRIRWQFGPDAWKAGSKGAEIAEWAKKHSACAEPLIGISPRGIRVVDRRVR